MPTEARKVYWRGPRALAAYAAVGVAVFMTFLAATFPYGDTLTSMLAPYRLKLTYQDQHMSPPIGAELTGVSLISTARGDDQAVLRSPAVRLAPTLASLLLGRPELYVRAALYGGMVHATVHQHAATTDLTFSLDSLSLDDGGPLRMFGAVVKGNISGSGTAQIKGPNLPDEKGRIAIAGDHFAVSIADGFPPIRLGTLTGNLQLNEGTLTLQNVQAHGGDVELKADGTIAIGDAPDDCTVDLTVYLNPTQSGRDHFGLFLKMLPHPPGPEAPYTIQGDLLSPSIT